ncbi:hypothetical protein GW927_04820 [Candidatus Pacearchaeota archaeon]|jgi:hypothetical protein|nr:hypothetical protein [Candidatus Pacearchaeota archaeon]
MSKDSLKPEVDQKFPVQDLQDAKVEIKYLARTWLDDFEKQVFHGKTVEELLGRGNYD